MIVLLKQQNFLALNKNLELLFYEVSNLVFLILHDIDYIAQTMTGDTNTHTSILFDAHLMYN
jgi:hypothetical protein